MFLDRSFVFFSIAVLCEAKIKINIKIAPDRDNVKVKYSGYDNKLITDKDIAVFNVSKDNLKRGLRVELGKVPDDVFYKDPTPYYNLFEKYKWPEVKRQIYVNKAKVIDVLSEEVVIASHEYVNNTTDTIQKKKRMQTLVECFSNSSWSKNGYPKDELIYNITYNFGNKNISYNNTWRDEGFQNFFLPASVVMKGLMDIKSGQTVVSKLIAKKFILLVEFDYMAKLVGNIIADYAELYGKYHFWSPTIDNILKAAKLHNGIITKERIELMCYTEPRLKAFDKDTGEEINLYKKIKLVARGGKKVLKVL